MTTHYDLTNEELLTALQQIEASGNIGVQLMENEMIMGLALDTQGTIADFHDQKLMANFQYLNKLGLVIHKFTEAPGILSSGDRFIISPFGKTFLKKHKENLVSSIEELISKI